MIDQYEITVQTGDQVDAYAASGVNWVHDEVAACGTLTIESSSTGTVVYDSAHLVDFKNRQMTFEVATLTSGTGEAPVITRIVLKPIS